MDFRNFSVLLSFLMMVQSQETSVEINKHCACPLNYDPHCGSNGKTYGNRCAFLCERDPVVVLVRKGECDKLIIPEFPEKPELCYCLAVFEPVCGSDGKTYFNACEIKCQENKIIHSDVVVVSEGGCSEPRLSTDDLPIVPTQVPKRASMTPCFCPKNYDPVCGTNKITYANRCMLLCARRNGVNVRIAKRGPCQE